MSEKYYLFELVKKAQNNDEEGLLKIIKKFKPLIKKLSRKLNYDGSETDLIIDLIEVVLYLPIADNKSLRKNEYIVGYIVKSLNYKYIKLSKKYNVIRAKEVEYKDTLCNKEYKSTELSLSMKDLLSKLTTLQKKVIYSIFVQGYSETEIANHLCISKQAVCNAKSRALRNIKKMLLAS